MTPRELRQLLFELDQKMTIEELRKLLFGVEQQDEQVKPIELAEKIKSLKK